MHVPHTVCNFKATAPKSITKTKHDFYWLLPVAFDKYVAKLAGHTPTGYSSFLSLKESLRHYFSDNVLVNA